MVAPQVPPGTGEAATVNPAPSVVRLSVNDVIVAAEAVVFVSVTVAVVVPDCTGVGLYVLVPVIAEDGLTTRFADATA
jgi:hypothetical protein